MNQLYHIFFTSDFFKKLNPNTQKYLLLLPHKKSSKDKHISDLIGLSIEDTLVEKSALIAQNLIDENYNIKLKDILSRTDLGLLKRCYTIDSLLAQSDSFKKEFNQFELLTQLYGNGKICQVLFAKTPKKVTNIYQNFINLYHTIVKDLPKVNRLTNNRKATIARRLKEYRTLYFFEQLFYRVQASDFLTGKTTQWRANFDWIMKPKNIEKIMDGNFDNRSKKDKMIQQLKDLELK